MCGEPPDLGRQGVRLMCHTRPHMTPLSSSAKTRPETADDFFASHVVRLDILKNISDTYQSGAANLGIHSAEGERGRQSREQYSQGGARP